MREKLPRKSSSESFQFRNSLLDWYQEIGKIKPSSVLVFCSEGKGARDPSGERVITKRGIGERALFWWFSSSGILLIALIAVYHIRFTLIPPEK
jgi:hypothetical protein